MKKLEFSFLTEREKEIYKLVKEFGSQKKAAEELGIVDSAVTSAIKSIRFKIMKLMNTLEECLKLGLIEPEEVKKVVEDFEAEAHR